jgi:hypothetical protein
MGVWLMFGVVFALVAWFFSRIVAKAGFSPWWALLVMVPLVNVIALWVFAFVPWPSFTKQQVVEP